MKIRINWGTGIVIAIVLFMAFILSFVYKVFALDEYKHSLVSEDYYKDELHYQEDIDNLNNALKLDQNIKISNSEKGIIISFPNDFDYQKIEGKIIFQKMDNQKIDFEKDIVLKSHEILIPDSLLVNGKWVIRVDWSYNNVNYLLKEGWFY